MGQPFGIGEEHPQLGKIQEVFAPSSDNLATGIALAFLVVGAGLVFLIASVWAVATSGANLPVNAEKGWSWVAVSLVAAAGVGLLIGGLLLVRFVRSLFSICIALCDRGLLTSNRKGEEAWPWDAIQRVVEVTMVESPLIVNGPARKLMPKTKSTLYRLESSSGKSLPIDRNSVERIQQFGEMLREVASRQSIAWHSEEVSK